MICKLWLWVFEFKLKRVADDKKIEFLAKELLKEVEAQGHSLKFTNGIYGADIKIYEFDNSHRLVVENCSSPFEIKCGKYKPIINKK